MTRQNVTEGPREILTRRCPTCDGDGIVISEATTVVDIERRLRALAAQSPRTKAFSVELNARVRDLLVGPGAAQLQTIEDVTKRRFFLKAKADTPLDHFAVLDKGPLTRLAPKAAVEEGQEVEIKLVEVGLYDADAGVGKLDGIDISVAGAAKLVGKKVRVRSPECSTAPHSRRSPARRRKRSSRSPQRISQRSRHVRHARAGVPCRARCRALLPHPRSTSMRSRSPTTTKLSPKRRSSSKLTPMGRGRPLLRSASARAVVLAAAVTGARSPASVDGQVEPTSEPAAAESPTPADEPAAVTPKITSGRRLGGGGG